MKHLIINKNLVGTCVEDAEFGVVRNRVFKFTLVDFHESN